MSAKRTVNASHDLTRRDFLWRTSVGATAIGLGPLAGCSATGPGRAPTAAAAGRAIGANDRLLFGVVGVGGMGGSHVDDLLDRSEKDNVRIVAVSDVYRGRASNRAKQASAPAIYDYREVLDRKDIDAIVVATPDHWHSKIAIDALNAGKHVYLQKPMTHTIPQALAVRDTVRKTGKVLQVGTQHTAEPRYRAMHKLIQEGAIGKPLWAEASYSRNSRKGEWNSPIPPGRGPTGQGDYFIDWDMWLGHRFGCAPKRAWDPDRYFHFRKYWDYSGGIATDLFYHKLAPLVLAISGPNGEYPLRAGGHGGIYVQKDEREVPDTFIIVIDYPGEYTIVLTSSMANTDGSPERIRGQYGTIEGDQIRMQNEWKPEFHARSGGRDEIKIESEQDRNSDHMANFIDVVRGKEKHLNCNVELGTAVQVAITMAVLSYRNRTSYSWDPKAERAVPA